MELARMDICGEHSLSPNTLILLPNRVFLYKISVPADSHWLLLEWELCPGVAQGAAPPQATKQILYQFQPFPTLMAPGGDTGRRGQPGKGLDSSGQENPRVQGWGQSDREINPRMKGWGQSDQEVPECRDGDAQSPGAPGGFSGAISDSLLCGTGTHPLPVLLQTLSYPKPAEPGSPPGPSLTVQGWVEPIHLETSPSC